MPSDAGFIALTMTFYDDYSQVTDRTYATNYTPLLDAGSNQHAETIPAAADQQAIPTIGQVTAMKVRVLEDPSDLTKGAWLTTVSYYDDRLRVVQTQSDNYRGGRDTLINRYNFTGQVISSYQAHYNPQAIVNNNTRIKTNLNYDHANRLLEVYKTINDADSTKRLVAKNVYDQLGQVKQKQLGQLPADGSFLETQDYSYNIRGWLKGINKDYANNDNSHGGNSRWFGMELSYDWGFANNQLNGNIGGNKWRSKGDGQQRAYGFGYDGANRLLYGDFNQYGSSWDRTAGVDFSMMMGNGTDPTTAYDENGNIKAMLQSGWQLGGSHPIDSLAYTYYTHSNKLQNVIDGRNDTATKLGDFRTSALSPYATGKTSAAIDYSYDVNGNLTRDLNKDIGSQTADGIIYNHLNLPWQVKVRSATGTKGTITYIYDATGTKLEKLTMDSAGGAETTTAYIGQFQYQGKKTLGSGTPADTLLFFGQEEGRVRVVSDTTGGQAKTGFKYDYFIKDHLGNTRMVLTEEQQIDLYPAATMEVADSALEDLYYSNLANTRVDLPMGYPADTTTKPNDKIAQLSSATGGQKVGPGIVLKVMAGDQFNIQVSSWYRLNSAVPGPPANPLLDLLPALISGVGGLPGGGHPSPALLSGNSAPLSSNITEFLSDTGSLINSSKPHAFVNWVLFDDQFNYVKESSGFDQVGGDQEFKKHKLLNLPVTKSGYLYIYVSNETPNVNVFFDNLQVSHVRGPLLEEDHYYPFGLTMAGITNEALKTPYAENKYRFQKQELQDKEFSDGSGLETYEFKYRMDDPQTGRFWSIDPLADKYVYNSTYAFSENKVTSNFELEGLEASAEFNVERDTRDVQTGTATAKQINDRVNLRAAVSLQGSKVLLKGGEVALMFAQPQIGIPLVLSDLTGVPVLPSPQAMAESVIGEEAGGMGSAATSDDAGGLISLSTSTNTDEPVGSITSARTSEDPTQLEINKANGALGEKIATDYLNHKYAGTHNIYSQVTGVFEDGESTVYDNIGVNAETGDVEFTNETKTGGGRLRGPQKRAQAGDRTKLVGNNVPQHLQNTWISSKTSPYKTTRIDFTTGELITE